MRQIAPRSENAGLSRSRARRVPAGRPAGRSMQKDSGSHPLCQQPFTRVSAGERGLLQGDPFAQRPDLLRWAQGPGWIREKVWGGRYGSTRPVGVIGLAFLLGGAGGRPGAGSAIPHHAKSAIWVSLSPALTRKIFSRSYSLAAIQRSVVSIPLPTP